MLIAEVRIYDLDGARQPLPEALLQAWQFELLERGGFGSSTLSYSAELDERQIRVLPQPGWKIEILFSNKYAYRGWVEVVRPPIAEDKVPAHRVEAVGMMGRMDSILVDAQYSRPGGSDVAWIFAEITSRKLTGSEKIDKRGGWAQVIESELGYNLEGASFFERSARESFDALAEAAVDKAIWGWDVADDGSNRLYVRQRPTSVTNDDLRFRVGREISFLEAAVESQQLTNAVKLTGGVSKVPNLVFNGSFEMPIQPGEAASGSLLNQASFESGAADWTRTGSASIENGNGKPGTYARTANHFLRLTGTDTARQTYDAGANIEGKAYCIEVYAACEDESGGATLHIEIKALDAGGADISSPVDESFAIDARTYQPCRRVFSTPDDTHQLKVTLSRVAGAGSALMVDDAYLFDYSTPAQDGWKQVDRGSAGGVVDWASGNDPFHGSWCVRVKATGCDGGNSNTVRLRPTSDHWISTRRHQRIIIRVRVRTEAAETMRLGLTIRNSNRVETFWDPDITTDADGEWHEHTAEIGTGAGERFLPLIEMKSNGNFDFDAVYVHEEGLVDTSDVTWYQTGENLEMYVRVDDPNLSELPAEVLASIDTYGLQERVLQIDELQEAEAAYHYLSGYFRRYAIPAKRGLLAIDAATVHARYVDDDDEATQLGLVAIDGARDAIEAQFPTRITYSGGPGTQVRCELELTNRRPDLALLLAKALLNTSRGGGAGSVGGSSSQSGGDAGDDSDDEVTGTLIVKEAGSIVSSDINTLDFGAGFDVSESPSGEANVTLDLSEQTWTGPFAVNGVVSVFSQTNAIAFLAREAAGQSQPLAAFQTSAGVSIVTILPSGALLSVIHPSTGGGQMRTEGYGNVPTFVGRRTSGSRTSQTATGSGNPMVRFQAVGHTGSGFTSSSSGELEFQAAEAFGASAWGTRAILRTTPIGSATSAEVLRADPAGGINIGGQSDNQTVAILEVESTSRGSISDPVMTTAQSDAITGVVGLRVYDSDLSAPRVYGSRWRWQNASLFVQTGSSTLGNSAAETTIIGSGVGSKVLPANYWKVGKTIRFRLWGHISETGTPTLQIKLKLDAVTLLDSGAITLPASLSSSRFCFEGEITCRTAGGSGTVMVQGQLITGGTVTEVVKTATVTVDTTQSDTIDVTAQWGTADAANTLTTTNGVWEALP